MAGNLEGASKSLPTTIPGALQSPRICDLVLVVGIESVCLLVEFELIKMTKMVNTGGNLVGDQPRIIAEELVSLYGRENIADFRACFHRAIMLRKYGEVVRVDAPTISGWIARYLEEKYEELEADLYRQKDTPYEPPKKPDSDPNFNLVDEFNKLHGTVTEKIKPMSRSEILRNGQIDPPRQVAASWPQTTQAEVDRRAQESAKFRSQWLADMRKKYPGLSDEQLNTMAG